MLRAALCCLAVAPAASLRGATRHARAASLRAASPKRLEYDHLYHAGSPVDVFKHCVLVALLRRCTEKASPLTYCETHAGRGLYAVGSPEAKTLAESEDGLGALRARARGRSRLHGDIAAFLGAQRPDEYAGSAALAAAALRPGDAAVFFERDGACAGALAGALARLGAAPATTVEAADGYAGARRLRAPTRGLVFVDPPYQSGSDTDQCAALCGHLRTHWRAARVAIWYPLGDGDGAARRADRLRAAVSAAAGDADVLDARLAVPAGRRLRSSGVLLVEPPYGFDDDLGELLPELADLLAAGGTADVAWLRRS